MGIFVTIGIAAAFDPSAGPTGRRFPGWIVPQAGVRSPALGIGAQIDIAWQMLAGASCFWRCAAGLFQQTKMAARPTPLNTHQAAVPLGAAHRRLPTRIVYPCWSWRCGNVLAWPPYRDGWAARVRWGRRLCLLRLRRALAGVDVYLSLPLAGSVAPTAFGAAHGPSVLAAHRLPVDRMGHGRGADVGRWQASGGLRQAAVAARCENWRQPRARASQ